MKYRMQSRVLLFLAISLIALSACRKKSPAGEGGAGNRAQIPETTQGISSALAAHLPANVPGALFVRDFTEALGAWPGFRERVVPYLGELGPIEADFRNTLGVDLNRPESFGETGVAPEGGLALSRVGDHNVALFLLEDAARFQAHATEVLQGRAFRLRADIEVRELEGATLSIYRARDGEPPKFAVLILGNVGVLFRGVNLETLDRDVGSIAAPDTTMSSNADFSQALSHFEDWPVLIWGTTEFDLDSSVEMVERLAARDVQSAVGLRLERDRIAGRQISYLSEEDSSRARRVFAAGGEAPAFDRLLSSDAYAFLRLSLRPSELLAVYRESVSGAELAEFEEDLRGIGEGIGMQVEQELLPALGDDMLLLATRSRLLTLMGMARSGNYRPSTIAQGFGLVVAIEIADRERLVGLLDRLDTRLEGQYERSQVGDNIVINFTRRSTDIGDMVITNDLLLIVPDRQRNELLERLAADSGAEEVEGIGIAAARELVTEGGVTGGFLDFARIVSGPLGQLAGAQAPARIRNSMGVLDEGTARMQMTDNGVELSFAITLSEPPE